MTINNSRLLGAAIEILVATLLKPLLGAPMPAEGALRQAGTRKNVPGGKLLT